MPTEQELADRLVEHEVICCMSSIIYDIGQHPEEATKVFNLEPDEVYDWFCVPDYEEAVSQTLNDLDFTELLDECDEVGYRDDALDSTAAGNDLARAILIAQDAYDRELAALTADQDPDDVDRYDVERLTDMDAEEWAADEATPDQLRSYEADLRRYIENHLTSTDEQREFCERHGVDLSDYGREVYEHWSVTPWLGSKLEARGERVFEFGGHTIWGRCCSGQSISLDWVIQQITKETYQ